MKLQVLSALHVIFLFSVSMLCFKATCLSRTGNETDRLALFEFKAQISNDPYGVLNSWNDSVNFCTWQGVTCSRRRQRVTSLMLNGLSLLGTISPYIGNLTFLRFLNLRNNRFHGEIPEEVGLLFRLRHLNLTNNTLDGEIPVSISYCSELRIVDFFKNSFKGKIPSELGFLHKLVTLMLAENNLIGEIPRSFGNLTSLKHISVAFNNMQGNIPNELGQLTSLTFFAIGANDFTGTIPSTLYNISSITAFSTAQNQLKGSLPANIGLTLPNLQYFGIGENLFNGTIPVSLSNFSQLVRLDISNNSFTGQVPNNLGDLKGLRLLNLELNFLGSNTKTDLNFLTSLSNFSNLQSLAFDANNFGGVLPSSIANLSALKELIIENNKIYGTIPQELGNLVNLYRLEMGNNFFSGSIPSSLGKLLKMQLLSLDANFLSGEIPQSLGNLTQLFELDLEINKIEGYITSSVANCQNLQSLDLSQNKLIGTIPLQIISLPSLSLTLNLSKNSLTGRLPKEVGNLKNLNSLDVSENKLSGEIPETIGDCLSLEILNMQGNSFQGLIPSSSALLRGLQYLDLSRNNLSGNIPKELQSLTFLQYLNLSFNNLEGEVPTGGVFRNSSAFSLAGNANLCGGIPELQLPACPIKLKKHNPASVRIVAEIISSVVFSIAMTTFYFFCWRKSRKSQSPTPFTANKLLQVSYWELFQATEGFCADNLIGQGHFGSVYRGSLDRQGKRLIAVKVLNLQQHGASKSFILECKTLRNIRHRNLVKTLTYCSSIDFKGNEFKAIVFDLMENGSLEMWLHSEEIGRNQSKNLDLLQRLHIAIDVASALHYLHDQCETPIIHCDLKPSNILLDSDMTAHVGDFGLARFLSNTTSSFSQDQTSSIGIKGTTGYMAPEYGTGSVETTYGDVYSYGIILLEIFTGKRPTDREFTDGRNLYNFVKANLPEQVAQVVDPVLLTMGNAEIAATAITMEELVNDDDSDYSEIQIQEDDRFKILRQNGDKVQKCIISVLKIGLACAAEFPKDRMNMRNAIKELNIIRDTFRGSGQRHLPSEAQLIGV